MAAWRLRQRYSEYRHRRLLGGDQRAGRYARRKALRLQEQFIRRAWKYLLVLAFLPDLLIPGVWLIRPPYRGFLIGLILPIGFWLAAGVVIVFSGAATFWMGRSGEVWTASELRRARRHGWRFLNDLYLSSQIDHVALGPAGVLVIETKWAAEPWNLDDDTDWRRQKALNAVTEQARQVRSIMVNHHCDAPVIALVVQWHPPVEVEPGTWHQDGDRYLIDGPSFQDWLKSRPTVSFNGATAEASWRHLLSHVGPRDKYVAVKEGPSPRTAGQLFWLVARPILIAFVALYCAAALARLFHPAEALIAIAAVAVLGLLAAVSDRLRKWGLLWSASISLAYGVALVVVLIRHYA
jgi:hypothetical protein